MKINKKKKKVNFFHLERSKVRDLLQHFESFAWDRGDAGESQRLVDI